MSHAGLDPTFVLCAVALAALAFGLGCDTLQMTLVVLWVRRRPDRPQVQAPVSILKPLCGIDDDLVSNLEHFATLDYPNYEVVLGVRDTEDSAYAVAVEATKRWPDRMRLVLQRSIVGLNPKVNQLCTLAQEARHELLVVSDSNVRVPPGYLDELVAAFERPDVACFTNPVVGIGERRWGSLLDNMHLGASIGSGMIAAKMANGHSIVVGKSMALRKADLIAMGGFEAAANHLAEDYVLGGRVHTQLRKRVALGRLPVYNVSQNRSIKEFLVRYVRWSIIHRTAIAPWTYLGQQLMNPIPQSLWLMVLHPARWTAGVVAGTWAWKTSTDLISNRQLRRKSFGWLSPVAVLLKDLLIGVAWLNGIFARTVDWRGNRLRVLHGSRLVPVDGSPLPGPQPMPVSASVAPLLRQDAAWTRGSGDDRFSA